MPVPRRGYPPEDPGLGFIQFGIPLVVVSGTGYVGPFGGSSTFSVFSNELDVQWACPRDAWLWKFRVHLAPAPLGNFTCLATIRLNGVPTPMRLTLNSSGSEFSDLVTQVQVLEGQGISLETITVVGTGTAFTKLQASVGIY